MTMQLALVAPQPEPTAGVLPHQMTARDAQVFCATPGYEATCALWHTQQAIKQRDDDEAAARFNAFWNAYGWWVFGVVAIGFFIHWLVTRDD